MRFFSFAVDADPCVLTFRSIFVVDGNGFSWCYACVRYGNGRFTCYTSFYGELSGVRPFRPFHIGIAVSHPYVIGTVYQFVFLNGKLGDVYIFIEVNGDV